MGLADELKTLHELLEAGVLSQEEYEEERARLMEERRTGAPASRTTGTPLQRNTGGHGQLVGAYKVHKLVGEGGMGAVYRGRHTHRTVAQRQGGDVAIKVMHPQYASRADFRDRFDREADVGLRLDHPNVVRVYDLVMDGGQLAMVMEWVEGRELAHLIGHEMGPIPWERAWPLFEQILKGVAHAHEEGVVHRDLKPENIIITEDNVAKVLDFGIAKAAGDTRTKTGTGMGTVHYMAPEQYRDAKSVDHRADIYALGMTLYEMLAGRLPWASGTTEFEILTVKSQGEFPPPTEYYPAIPPHVVDAVMSCVAVDAAERPQSVGELLGRLGGERKATGPVAKKMPKAPSADSGKKPPAKGSRDTGASSIAPKPVEAPAAASPTPVAKTTAVAKTNQPIGLVGWLVRLLWLPLFGWWGIAQCVVGAVLCVTLIGLPFGMQWLKIGTMSIYPFERQLQQRDISGLELAGNLLWLVLFGWELAIIHALLAVVLTLTVVGVPFAKRHVQLIPLALSPFGKSIVPG